MTCVASMTNIYKPEFYKNQSFLRKALINQFFSCIHLSCIYKCYNLSKYHFILNIVTVIVKLDFGINISKYKSS